jgi:putative cell wall-binding protein
MKKSIQILILLSLYSLLQAESISAEQKIYNLIFTGIFPHKYRVHVWVDDTKKREILSGMSKVIVVSSKKDADLLLVAKNFHIVSDKILFVSSYALLKHYRKSVVGGFYWKKGRPNLLFLRKNLSQHHITLPRSLQKYVEEEL